MMMPNVGRNKRSALRRMDWCNALRLLHPTELEVLNAQARELEQTIAQNVAEILEA
jgi:hypothetical protein